MKNPKVFISYCWTSEEYQLRIIEWAQRLMQNGVNVILDKWDLKEGQDKNVFMEQMVANDEIDKVLLFSNKMYSEKADKRQGGVGTESQIISAAVYEKVNQSKFIPIVCERDGSGKEYLPTYLKSRIYIDFSNEQIASDEFHRLLRILWGKPEFVKPELGDPPIFVSEDRPDTSYKLKFIRQEYSEAITKGRPTVKGLAKKFKDTFYVELSKYRINAPEHTEPLDELVFSSIESMKPYRDEFIEFCKITFEYITDREILDIVCELLEKCLEYKGPPEGMTSWQTQCFDNHSFILHEMFLISIAILIDNKKYEYASYMLRRSYFLPMNVSPNQSDRTSSFEIFCTNNKSLRDRDKRLNTKLISPVGELLKQRSFQSDITFLMVTQADFIIWLYSAIHRQDKYNWFPYTLCYHNEFHMFEIFVKAASKENFDKLKLLLHISTKEDIVKMAETNINQSLASVSFGTHWPYSVILLINYDKLDTKP